MIIRRSLTTVAATALLFGGAGTAWAGDSHDMLPGADTALVQVFVNSEADVDKLSTKYDLAEYKQVEDDGTISAQHRRQCRRSARSCARRASASARRSRTPRRAPRSTPSATRPRALERPRARPGQERRAARRHQARGQVGRADPGRDRHPARQQVHELRRHVPLRRGAQQGDRARPGTGNAFTGPTLALSFAGADGVYRRAPPTWAASSTPTRRPTSTCTTAS